MTAIILTIQAMIVLALIGVVLLQRSDGAGGLGMGGGGGGGGLMSSRGAATALTRTTTVLAGLFFANSLIFSLVVDQSDDTGAFLPVNERGEPTEDDFSDFILPSEDEGEEAAPDAFELPDDLGASDEEAPAEETDEGEPQR
ncbi:preprotein translocase subunit SecG [Parvularcula maris]|uniref:Protein-export membrane protein SecG n=1 Tax=Parvularcula maris TaxID=2965077 RepID=A0A9X2RHS5_9PROT|nr:preprotein translocase subunit SecG [Parvularcula maris]MCQ8185174.1 preprotein translocase subunit SecG [Parvularcula maris]